MISLKVKHAYDYNDPLFLKNKNIASMMIQNPDLDIAF
jgi:hypothetical protein